MLKFIINLAVLTLFVPIVSLSQNSFVFDRDFQVGKSPVKSFFDPTFNKLHIFCMGYDANFNGIFDQNDDDENPSWWIIDFQSMSKAPKKVREFKFASLKFPFRPSFDTNNRKLLIPHIDRVSSYNIDDYSIVKDELFKISASSVYSIGDLVILTIPDAYNTSGEIKLMNQLSGLTLKSFKSGINPQESIMFSLNGGLGFAIANIGSFGSDSSTIYYGSYYFSGNIDLDSIVIGNTVNHIFHDKGKIYSTLNGSHSVKSFDIKTKEVLTYYTGTSGYNGPRESVLLDDKLFVSTYAGNIRLIDLKEKAMTDIINDHGLEEILNDTKSESVTFIDEYSFISSNPFNTDYSPNDKIGYFVLKPVIDNIKTIIVGKQPVRSYNDLDNYKLHIFCAGLDKNNNGAADKVDGDEFPSWWVIDYSQSNLSAEKVREFELGSFKIPFNPVFDNVTKLVGIPLTNTISIFSLLNYGIYMEDVVLINANSISIEDDKILVTENFGDTLDSRISIYLKSTFQPIFSMNVAPNIIDGKIFLYKDTLNVAFICNHPKNNFKTTLYYGKYDGQFNLTLDSIETGFNANSLCFDFDKNLIVTNTGDSKITMFDLSKKFKSDIYTGNNSENGPREVLAMPKAFIVSTWQGDLRVYNSESGCLDMLIPMKGKVESANEVYYSPTDKVYVVALIRFNLDGSVGNTINLLNPLVSDIKENISETKSSGTLYPNPTSNSINLKLFENINVYKIEIVDLMGNSVFETNLNGNNSNEISIPLKYLGVNSGSYILKMMTSKDLITIPFIVVK